MNRIDLIPQWWDWPEVQEMRRALEGQPACFIGGALRDAIVHFPIRNFNIYTTLPPEAVIALLNAVHIEIKTKGAFFGEVKAIIGKQRFFIATEKNQFSPAIKISGDFLAAAAACAGNYDFTINTLFMDLNGDCYDNFCGAEDARNGHIRFTNNPIRSTLDSPERILRFFRLYAWFGKEAMDETSLAVCIANSELLAYVPPEKIGSEMWKLFAGARFATALSHMDQRDILSDVIGLPFFDQGWLSAMEKYELAHGIASASARRVALLLLSIELPPETALMHLSELWRLSTAKQQAVRTLIKFLPYADERSDIDKLGITEQEYKDIILMRTAMGETAPAEAYP